MRPYPWDTRRNAGNARAGAKLGMSVARALTIVAAVFTVGVGPLLRLLAEWRFQSRNDGWAWRGVVMMAVGGVAMPIFGGPVEWAQAVLDLLYSFGSKATMEPVEAARTLLLAGVPMGLVMQGVATALSCYELDQMGERYLLPSKPGMRVRLRNRRTIAALRSTPESGDGILRFGVIEDDPIPWRTGRVGMVVGRPVATLGHGLVVGATGTGKSVLAMTMVHQVGSNGQFAVVIDFKASLATYNGIRAAAELAGAPFHSFDLGLGSAETSWYDMLAWDGEPADKASMLVSAFSFADSGDAAFYRGQAEAYLTLQFQALQAVPSRPDESTFDYLLRTATPSGLKEHLVVLKGGDAAAQEQWTRFGERLTKFRPDHLSGLNANLANVVNTGGARLRPNGAPPITLGRVAQEGGVFYIGLSSATNEVALRTLGSLALRDVSVMSGARQRAQEAHRRGLIVVDEASRLGSRADVLNTLYATARAADLDVWTYTQSFAEFPPSTAVEVRSNANTLAVFRTPDPDTREMLSVTFGDIPAVSEMTDRDVTHRTIGGDVSERGGDSREQVVTRRHIPASWLGDPQRVPNQRAFITFSGSQTRATVSSRWKPRRQVRRDEIGADIPLVRIVVPTELVSSAVATRRPAADPAPVPPQPVADPSQAPVGASAVSPETVETGRFWDQWDPGRTPPRAGNPGEPGEHPVTSTGGAGWALRDGEDHPAAGGATVAIPTRETEDHPEPEWPEDEEWIPPDTPPAPPADPVAATEPAPATASAPGGDKEQWAPDEADDTAAEPAPTVQSPPAVPDERDDDDDWADDTPATAPSAPAAPAAPTSGWALPDD